MVKGTLHQRYLRDKQKAVQAVPLRRCRQRPGRAESRANNRRHGRLRHPRRPAAGEPDYAIMDERATDPAYYGKQYAIAVRKDDPELLNAINDALAAVMATPDFQQMQQKWFK